jgi:exodeoxyribonuclease V gamma subunit
MLDEFDNEAGRPETEGIAKLRVDLFSEGDGETLLQQVQAAVRDLRPLSEHPHQPPPIEDRSIEFHVAHSTQREVEVLHDQLLSWFEQDPSLRPRDIVVMVPDIDTFSAAIHAVFDQHRRSDPRFIPFEIGDVKDRSVNPLLVAVEWLLRLPQQRCRQSEVRDLLDVPAVAARFGLDEDDLSTLGHWIEGAGVRWGLDSEHRAGLGLGAAGEQNAWMFGVRRMLLGYASGAGANFRDIEPYAEVGGLDAALAGSLAQLIESLLDWRARLAVPHRPAEWGELARALLAAFFDARIETDRLTLAQLSDALLGWLETCDNAGFDEEVPLAVLREAWLGQIDEPTLNHQFVSGGVTFCTLMPMRAVPFRVVCLLGMNDGDFPRRAQQADFDLLALPGMARPGDRSRRDDDRYLMLEALLAARDKLYVSWVGRNVRDNSEQPASVLVSQLRDYLAAGWDFDVRSLSTVHALQPFSRVYFEEGGLPTYAGEWRAAHATEDGDNDAELPPYELEPDYSLKLAELAQFVRQPARYFFRRRLGVSFMVGDVVGEDEEPFALDALQRYHLEHRLLDDAGKPEEVDDVHATLAARAEGLGRQGLLPIGLVGQQWQRELVAGLVPVRTAWLELVGAYPDPAPKLAVSLELAGVRLDDWVDRLRTGRGETAWLMQISSKVLNKNEAPRGDKLIGYWLRQLAAAAAGTPVTGYLVARDAVVAMRPLEQAGAQATLEELVRLWRRNLDQPLPVACKAALAQLLDDDPRAVYDGGFEIAGEVEQDQCLARLWPEFALLQDAAGNWPGMAEEVYGALVQWMDEDIQINPIEGDEA